MATSAATSGDISGLISKIKDQTASQNIAASVQAERSSKIEKGIDKWAKSNKVDLEGIQHDTVSESATQMTQVVDQLTANMFESGMNSGEIWDELKSMHIGLADAFETQYDFDVQRWREEKERLAELDRKAESKAEGKDAVDTSLDFNPLTILAAVTGFIVGFFQGFFGPMGALMKSWGLAIKNFFAKPLKLGWTKFKDMLKTSKIKLWYDSVKGWFKAKLGAAGTKWSSFKNMMANSKIGGWYQSIKNWFTAAGRSSKTGKFTPSKWTSIKKMFANSKIGKLFTGIKNFFKAPIGAKLPMLKNLFMKSPIGKLITSISALFKTKPPGTGIMDDVTKVMKKLFGKGGVFNIFRKIGAAFGKIFFFVQIFMTLFDFYTGFVETKGNLLDKILGGLKAAFVGFFGGFMDLGIMLEDGIKWIVKKIAGFFGFDEDEVAASMESFSIFKPLKKMVTDVADWFVGLFDFSSFSAGLISMAKLIFLPITALLDLVGFVWDWFMELFGWKDENAPADDRTLTTKLGDLLIGVWDWFMGIFGFDLAKSTPADDGQTVFGKLGNLLVGVWDWFLDLFGFGDGHSAEMPADDGQTVMGKLLGLVTGVWTWFKGLFGFGEGGGATTPVSVESVTMTLANLLVGAWSWFKGLFGFSSPEDDADTAKGVGGFLKDLVDGVWGYFKKLFQFGSIGDVMKSYFNLLTFFPNIIKDAIAGVTSWLLGLFGFDEAAKTVANAQNFSLGDMIFNAIESIWLWFKDLLNIDVASIAKMIPGAGALLSLLDDSAAEKNVEGMTKAGLMKSDEGTLDADQIVDIGKLQGMMKGMSLEGIKNMMMEMKEINESDMIGKGDEIANWEVVQKTLQEGAKLAALQKEANELSGSGGTTTIIQDNSQNQSNSSQPLVLPTPAISPGNGGNVLQK